MSFRLSITLPLAVALAAACCWTGVAQDARTPVAPPLPSVKAPESEVTSLQKRVVALGEALAASNAEVETLREQHAQLKLQMESLGVAALKGDERSVQKRLLQATAELAASEKARLDITEKANRLAEAATACMVKPGEPVLKAAFEQALRDVTAAKPAAAAPPVALDAARIVSFKPELSLAVLNAGRDSGIRMGAPFNVVRSDKSIASGLVVQVNDRISGILITGSTGAQVRVGDAVKPELTQTTPKK